MKPSRIACLQVPLFPLAARLRSEPELVPEALAIFEGGGTSARVCAATRPARRAGIRPGLTLTQARARLPKLIARHRDGECERAAQEALLDVAESFSPRVEDGGEGLAYLDARGLDRHHPGEDPELELARALVREAERRAGLPAWAGLASSKLAARVAAGQGAEPTVVAAEAEAEFLAPLPLGRLSAQGEILTTLERWGVRSVGEFARLPKNEVSSRLGAAAQELHAVARGLDPRPLAPRVKPPDFREGMALEWPLVTLEPFLFVTRAALERLASRLESQGLGCRRLEVSLELEPDGHHERAIELPAPTREVKTLLKLLQLDLEAHPPGAPVMAFTLVAHPDRPRGAQLTLFGPAELAPDRLATTLARLFALLGEERVGSPRLLDSHRPEGFALEPFAPPPPPKVRPETPPGRSLMSARALRPALELEVIVEETSGKRPRTLESLLREGAEKKPKIAGEVRVASGPWGLEEGWWREEPVEREYWDVELSDGGLYRIFRNRRSGEWYADGIYD